jgi:hypothetical protein
MESLEILVLQMITICRQTNCMIHLETIIDSIETDQVYFLKAFILERLPESLELTFLFYTPLLSIRIAPKISLTE